MGQRGPKPGWKKGVADPAAPTAADNRRKAAAPAAPVVAAASHLPPAPPPPPPQAAPSEQPRMSAADLANPAKLTGEALRKLAHRNGVSRSEASTMSDEKLRLQLRYITNRQYADEES